MFKYNYEIRYSDYKDFDKVKTSSILEVIQEAAIRDSEANGHGIEKLRSMDRAWILQGINVRIEKPVSTHFPLTVSLCIPPPTVALRLPTVS